MKPFPYPARTTPGTVQFSFCDDRNSTIVKLVSEGAGHFAEIEVEGTLALDPKELTALAQWVAETCAELDAQEGSQQ